MKGCCFWEENEIPECMKCGCGKKSFFHAELVEQSRIKRAGRRLRMAESRSQTLSEETLKEVKSKILGLEEQIEVSDLEKKAALAVEIAELIAARTGEGSYQLEIMSLTAALLFGGSVRLVCGQ